MPERTNMIMPMVMESMKADYNPYETLKNITYKDDVVQKGQILISGTVSSEHAETRYVHADGEVYAKTWYAYKAKVPYIKDVVGKTGIIEKRYKIKLLKYEINLLNYGTKFEKYDTITTRKQFKLLDKFILPIEVEETTYEELVVDTINYTKTQAENIAKNQAMSGALGLLPKEAENVNNSLTVREYDDGIEAEVMIECIEKIGTKEKLGG